MAITIHDSGSGLKATGAPSVPVVNLPVAVPVVAVVAPGPVEAPAAIEPPKTDAKK